MSFSAQLIYMVSWILGLPLKRIVPTTDVYADLNLDSYDFQLLIFQLEEYYHCECTPEEIERIATVKDLIETFKLKAPDSFNQNGMEQASFRLTPSHHV